MAKVMVRHEANLSGPEAHRRASAAKTLRVMPEVREAFGAGRIGRCQVTRIANAHADPRWGVRHHPCPVVVVNAPTMSTDGA